MQTFSVNRYSLTSQIPSLLFKGDINKLRDLAEGKAEISEALAAGDNFVPRSNISVQTLAERFLDPANPGPFLLTGPAAAGKSVMGRKVAEYLTDKGYPVTFISNSYEDPLNSSRLEELRRDIQTHPTDLPYFLFLDEPMFTYLYAPINGQPRTIPSDDQEYIPSQSGIAKLLQLQESHPNLRIVGMMFDKGFSWPSLQLRLPNHKKIATEELKKLFPEGNHIPLPPLTQENPDSIIRMVNQGLRLAGFYPLSAAAEAGLRGKNIKQFRDIFFNLYDALSRNKTRTNDPNRREIIQTTDWQTAWNLLT